ncbi:unnamed protein product [Caretta caretta]
MCMAHQVVSPGKKKHHITWFKQHFTWRNKSYVMKKEQVSEIIQSGQLGIIPMESLEIHLLMPVVYFAQYLKTGVRVEVKVSALA